MQQMAYFYIIIYIFLCHNLFCSQGARHTGGDIQGKNIANPMSLLFASTLMLEHLG